MAQATTNVVTPPRGIRETWSDIQEHVVRLVRLEVALAKEEARKAADDIRRGAALAMLAAVAVLLGLEALIIALVAGVATWLPVWASAAAVGAVFLVAAVILGLAGFRRLRLDGLRPSSTLETLRDTKEWIKERR